MRARLSTLEARLASVKTEVTVFGDANNQTIIRPAGPAGLDFAGNRAVVRAWQFEVVEKQKFSVEVDRSRRNETGAGYTDPDAVVAFQIGQLYKIAPYVLLRPSTNNAGTISYTLNGLFEHRFLVQSLSPFFCRPLTCASVTLNNLRRGTILLTM